MFTLKHNVALYVPSTIGVDTAIDNMQIVLSVATQMAGKFGGAHLESQTSTGFYIANDGKLVAESTKVLRAFVDDVSIAMEFMINLARELCVELTQESVLVVVDGEAFFVDSGD
jgi:hypothetical protein